ncbi:MAG TPA: cytochrome P450 [Acidimicrobiales bacterium]
MEPYTLDVPRRADPYPYYAELRREDPVHYSPVEDIWVLTRFDDCMAAFSDPQVWSSQRRGNLLNDLPERIGRTLGTTDPPRHTFARRLVNKAFTPRTVAGLEPLIRADSASLHDAACAKGTFEYVHDISAPLNARILGTMFGVPEGEFLRVRDWLDDFFVRDKPEPGREPRQVVAMRELRAYVDTLVEARLQDPGDDLMSAMLAAREDGEALTHEQVAVTTMTFLTAGFESTNNLFTNMVHALAELPDIHARLRADAALCGAFTEEAMRWDAAAQGFVRTPMRDLEIRDTKVPEGAQVLVHIGAANRDPDAFPDPDRFDLDRAGGRQLGLGHGTHFCVGAPLGRVLARVAVEDLVARAPTVAVDMNRAVRVSTPNFRGFQRLDVTVA